MRRPSVLLVVLLAAVIALPATAKGQDPSRSETAVLHEGMEWIGTYKRATVKKNAPNILSHKKAKNVDVDKFRLWITSVDGPTISGQFAWHHDEHPAAVTFKGTVAKNGQFHFPITDVVKGSLGQAFIEAALEGSFGPNAETIGGVFNSKSSRRVGAFEGQLNKEKAKGGKKKGKKG